MVVYLPIDLIAPWLGGNGARAIHLAVLIGVPAYPTGDAAVPIVAGLLDSGMAPGAALAFMTAGERTSVPAARAEFALVERPVFVRYLALPMIGSALSGLLYKVAGSLWLPERACRASGPCLDT